MKLKYALSGAAAGLANGFFGAGGGTLLIPLLTRWCKVETRRAFACSVAVILPMCAVSVVVYWMQEGLSFSTALPFLVGGLAGGLLAGLLFKKVSVPWLRRAFGILLVLGGLRIVL